METDVFKYEETSESCALPVSNNNTTATGSTPCSQPLSVHMSSTELVKAVEMLGFNDGAISTSCYSKKNVHKPPTKPEVPLTKQELSPPTPCIFAKSKEDAFSPQLFQMCLQQPIVVIRNLCHKDVCDIDLSLYSTKVLVDKHPHHAVEIRSQLEQTSDENWDPSTDKQVNCRSKKLQSTSLRM